VEHLAVSARLGLLDFLPGLAHPPTCLRNLTFTTAVAVLFPPLLLLPPLSCPRPCSWDRYGHNGSHHRGMDDKVTGRHHTTTTTVTQPMAPPLGGVRGVDEV
jgi:hypothetical protein